MSTRTYRARRLVLGLLVGASLQAGPPSAAAGTPQRLYILHTNDIHGHMTDEGATFISPEFYPTLNGSAGMATVIKEYREKAADEGAGFLMVDAGDIMQGTPESNFFYGESMNEIFNAFGDDAVELGNHEFDFGMDRLQAWIGRSRAPVLASNLLEDKTGQTWDKVHPYVIRQFGDLRVGIIGILTHHMTALATPKNFAGLKTPKAVETLPPFIKRLREEDQCDVVSAVSHFGRETELEIMEKVPGIDLLIGGHSHFGFPRAVEDPYNHTLYGQNYGNGSAIGGFALDIDPKSHRISGYKRDLFTMFEDDFEKDPGVAKIVKKYADQVSVEMDKTIGESAMDMGRDYRTESVLGNWVTDVMRKATGADLSMQNSGGLRNDIQAGPLTNRSIFNVYPFDNKMVKMEIQGKTVKALMERSVTGDGGIQQISGATIKWNPNRPKGARVTEIKVGGQPLDLEKWYTFVTIDFIVDRAGCKELIEPARNKTYTGMNVRDLLVDEVKANSPIRAKVEGRIGREK